jgi:hypothetical protein
LNGDVRFQVTVAVTSTGLLEEGQLLVRGLEEVTTELTGEGCCAVAVLGVVFVVEATGVVEPGEELDDDGVCACDPRELKAHGANARPVGGSVDAFPIELEL